MRAIRFVSVLVCLGALPAGCAIARRAPGPPPDPAADGRIQREVEARLAAEPAIGPGNVRVSVTGGTVTLHGSVRGLGALQCAITNAGLVAGVQTVVDHLVLERGPRDVRCLSPRPDTAASVGVRP